MKIFYNNFIKNKRLIFGFFLFLLIAFFVKSSVASNLLTPCQIEARDAEANPYQFSLSQSTPGVTINADTGIISGSSAITGNHSMEIIATDEYHAVSDPVAYTLTVNSYCGDGIKQNPNMEGQGGPANDGREVCDGNDGIAINPADSIGGSKMYACSGECVEGTDCTDSCSFLDASNGGGWCGDGVTQTIFGEECDPGETALDYSLRTGDTSVLTDDAKWQAIHLSCDSTNCAMGCVGNPLLAEGCYIDTDKNGVIDGGECQKGKNICINNTLSCFDVYSSAGEPPKFDYCCTGESVKLACAGNNTGACAPVEDIGTFTVARAIPTDLIFSSSGGYYGNFKGAYTNKSSTFYYYTCDYVCKEMGQVCIGVGLNNHETMSCTSVVHDGGGNCLNSGNTVYDDCKSYFSLAGASTASSVKGYNFAGYLGTCSDQSHLNPPLSPRFHVGEAACYCQ